MNVNFLFFSYFKTICNSFIYNSLDTLTLRNEVGFSQIFISFSVTNDDKLLLLVYSILSIVTTGKI